MSKNYRVGYKRPPKEHQFKKGISGNPRGRPKRLADIEAADPLRASGQRANQLLLREAYREVSVREGDDIITLPAIQAVFRAMGVAAMKQDRAAQRLFASLVDKIEADDRECRVEHLKTLMGYKSKWEFAISAAMSRGSTPPDPVPHPDDIKLDFATGSASINGPKTKDEKRAWDGELERRDALQQAVTTMAIRYKRARSEVKKQHWLQYWVFTQRKYDELNDNLPQRYRQDLKDRCWEEGASRPGSQKTRHWPGE